MFYELKIIPFHQVASLHDFLNKIALQVLLEMFNVHKVVQRRSLGEVRRSIPVLFYVDFVLDVLTFIGLFLTIE
jgi:hypothetical protein